MRYGYGEQRYCNVRNKKKRLKIDIEYMKQYKEWNSKINTSEARQQKANEAFI